MPPNELDFTYLFVMSFINRRRSDLRFILSEVIRYVCPAPRLVRARCNFSKNGEQEFRLYQISSNSRDNHNIRLNLSSGPFTTLSRAQDPRHPSTSISILKNASATPSCKSTSSNLLRSAIRAEIYFRYKKVFATRFSILSNIHIIISIYLIEKLRKGLDTQIDY